jgi:hypothetical protein
MIQPGRVWRPTDRGAVWHSRALRRKFSKSDTGKNSFEICGVASVRARLVAKTSERRPEVAPGVRQSLPQPFRRTGASAKVLRPQNYEFVSLPKTVNFYSQRPAPSLTFDNRPHFSLPQFRNFGGSLLEPQKAADDKV